MNTVEREAPPLRVRWVTWFPVPYWTDRFNVLANRPGVDLEVVFLEASNTYYNFAPDPSEWSFRYRVLRNRSGKLGFYRRSPLPRHPEALVIGPTSIRLVMPYADATFMIAAAMARLRRMRYSLFVANTFDGERSGARAYEIAKRWMFRHADGCLATGPLQAAYAQRYALDVPISIIGNPVNVSRFGKPDSDVAEKRRRLRDGRGWNDRFVVGYVGRLAPEKDLPTLIRAAASLSSKGIRITIALAGDGPIAGHLRTMAVELGVALQCCGFLDGQELGDFYRTLDAFCLPSVSEAWGLVVNEAMAMGVPIVLSDRVGSRTLVHDGESGLVFRAGDDAALGELLTRLARSAKLRSRLSVAATRAIEPHTLTAWAEAVIDALES